jgi:hypothetical protein
MNVISIFTHACNYTNTCSTVSSFITSLFIFILKWYQCFLPLRVYLILCVPSNLYLMFIGVVLSSVIVNVLYSSL